MCGGHGLCMEGTPLRFICAVDLIGLQMRAISGQLDDREDPTTLDYGNTRRSLVKLDQRFVIFSPLHRSYFNILSRAEPC